jgi:hypothetical protein
MLLSNLRTTFKRTCKGSFEELGKSFKGIFKVLGQVLQSKLLPSLSKQGNIRVVNFKSDEKSDG